jgi:hypothetical protein
MLHSVILCCVVFVYCFDCICICICIVLYLYCIYIVFIVCIVFDLLFVLRHNCLTKLEVMYSRERPRVALSLDLSLLPLKYLR